MPAQLDPPALVPSPCYWLDPPPWAGGRGILFWFVFPTPLFFISPVLFVSLALGVEVATTCWLSDSGLIVP